MAVNNTKRLGKSASSVAVVVIFGLLGKSCLAERDPTKKQLAQVLGDQLSLRTRFMGSRVPFAKNNQCAHSKGSRLLLIHGPPTI